MTDEETVDKLIVEFDQWFRERGNDKMVKSERAIIKTFCWFLMHEKDRTTIPHVEPTRSGKENEDGEGTQSSSPV